MGGNTIHKYTLFTDGVDIYNDYTFKMITYPNENEF